MDSYDKVMALTIDDLTMALFHDRIAASQDPDAMPDEPELKYSRRHSASDEAALEDIRKCAAKQAERTQP
jgi:hypothetical protein